MSFEASDVRGATTGAITPKIGCWIFRKINLSPELNGRISARLNPFSRTLRLVAGHRKASARADRCRRQRNSSEPAFITGKLMSSYDRIVQYQTDGGGPGTCKKSPNHRIGHL